MFDVRRRPSGTGDADPLISKPDRSMKLPLASVCALVLSGCVASPQPYSGAGDGRGSPAGQGQPPGQRTSCSASFNSTCSGCSVSCPVGKQASCTEGEVRQTDGSSPVCWT